MESLKVSSKSEPKSVAGAIAAIVRNGDTVEIHAIGAAAVNQVVKSIAVARNYVQANDIELVCMPAFAQLQVDGTEKTALRFVVEKR